MMVQSPPLFVLLTTLLAVALSSELPTGDEIAKMRVKQLKILLHERGVECRGQLYQYTRMSCRLYAIYLFQDAQRSLILCRK